MFEIGASDVRTSNSPPKIVSMDNKCIPGALMLTITGIIHLITIHLIEHTLNVYLMCAHQEKFN